MDVKGDAHGEARVREPQSRVDQSLKDFRLMLEQARAQRTGASVRVGLRAHDGRLHRARRRAAGTTRRSWKRSQAHVNRSFSQEDTQRETVTRSFDMQHAGSVYYELEARAERAPAVGLKRSFGCAQRTCRARAAAAARHRSSVSRRLHLTRPTPASGRYGLRFRAPGRTARPAASTASRPARVMRA